MNKILPSQSTSLVLWLKDSAGTDVETDNTANFINTFVAKIGPNLANALPDTLMEEVSGPSTCGP